MGLVWGVGSIRGVLGSVDGDGAGRQRLRDQEQYFISQFRDEIDFLRHFGCEVDVLFRSSNVLRRLLLRYIVPASVPRIQTLWSREISIKE